MNVPGAKAGRLLRLQTASGSLERCNTPTEAENERNQRSFASSWHGRE